MLDHRTAIALRFCLALTAALLPWSAVTARAADVDPDSPRWEVAMYLWGTGASGTIATSDASKDFDLSFSDILDKLNIGAMAAGQVRWGRWLAQFDSFYSQVEEDTETGIVHVDSGPGTGSDVSARAEGKLDEAFVDLKAGYALLDAALPDQPASDPRRYGLDFLVGARWWYVKPTIDVRVGPLAGDYEDSDSWVDGLVGMQAWIDLTPRLRFTATGDVGGFGIGSASDRSWKATALLRWQMNARWNAYLGYRGMYVEHPMGENGDLDLRHYGPMLGVGFAF